jgi:alkylhydroperoxidase family enzyme
MDIGSAVGREAGVREEQALELPRYRTSAAFDERERALLDLAVAMAQTPAEIPPELTERLRKYFDETELVELAATIAWENYEARFNRVFGVRSSGFSEGAFCAMPEGRS